MLESHVTCRERVMRDSKEIAPKYVRSVAKITNTKNIIHINGKKNHPREIG